MRAADGNVHPRASGHVPSSGPFKVFASWTRSFSGVLRTLAAVVIALVVIANSAAQTNTNSVADTKFSPGRGFYFAPITVTIQCATPGATIVYTTNSTDPSLTNGIAVFAANASTTPTAQVAVATTTLLRAAAFLNGLVPTDIDTHTYIFPAAVAKQTAPAGASPVWVDDPPGNGLSNAADFAVSPEVVTNTLPGYSFTNALLALPTLSLVTPMSGLFGYSNGIYVHPLKDGDAWERRTSTELIYPDGKTGFHVDSGLSLHGATSRQNAMIEKHSFHLAFRSQYGAPKLQFKVFPDSPVNEFDDLLLRACSTDAWAISNIISFLWANTNATYQRDQWMRDSQRDMGQPTAHGTYVNLYLNGLYWGLYNLTEHIGSSFGASYLGGKKEDYDVIVWDFNTNHIVSSGNDLAWKKMTNMADFAATNAAKYWQIQGKNPDGTRNPTYPVYVDVDNLIDYMLLHIYGVATDWPNRNWWALRQRDASTNQLDSTGFKFLVWDQEVAVDRTNRTYTWSNGTLFEQVNQVDTPAQIYDRLRRNYEFRLRFADRLQKHLLNGGALSLDSNRARWAARAAEIDYAIVGESARWGDMRHSPSFKRETDWLAMQSFTQNTFWPVNETAAWQRFRNVSLFPTLGAPVFNQYGGNVAPGFQLTMALSGTSTNGSVVYTVDGSDPRMPGGAVAASARVYSAPLPIQSPQTVHARVKDGTNWSPVIEATFTPPQDLSTLALTEIMYNPAGTNSPWLDGEFIELKNTGTVTLNLSGVKIPAVNYTFPVGKLLAAGRYCVLVRTSDETRFRAKHPTVTIDGMYSGGLDNGGETIECVDAAGTRIFSMTYDDDPPWPAAADGLGFSLVPREGVTTQAPDDAAQWRASTYPGGSPGAADPTPIVSRILINEILSASEFPEVDRVELFNPTGTNVDISNWYLTDDRSVPNKYVIKFGTVVPAYGFTTLSETQFNATANGTNAFALSSNGDELYLFSGGSDGKLTGYSHGVSFKASDPGVSFGRYVNSVGDESWPAQVSRSFGATNAGPLVGPIVINEINYHPSTGGDPFVELKNITASPIALYSGGVATNAWKLAGLDYVFPAGVVVPPQGMVLLVSIPPATFISKYAVPPEVQVFGPYTGALQKDGELLTLEKPSGDKTAWIVVDEVRYNDKAPWPPEADGLGYSLSRFDPAQYANDPANWRATQPTAGKDNGLLPLPYDPLAPVQFTDIRLNQTTNGMQVQLTFVASSNVIYSVLWSDRVSGGVWSWLQDVDAQTNTHPVIITQDMPADAEARFYRLEVPVR